MKQDNTVQIEAYRITRELVCALRRKGRLPPPAIFSDDDEADTASEVFARHVLPMLKRYDASRAALSTFIYLPVIRWAPRIAWRLVKGGINTSEPIVLVPIDGDDSDGDEGDDDGRGTVCTESPADVTELPAYDTPPEGFEPPGSDEWLARVNREATIAHVRRLVAGLSPEQREAIHRRVLTDTPSRGRMAELATPEAIIAALRERWSEAELAGIDWREDKTSLALATSASDSASDSD